MTEEQIQRSIKTKELQLSFWDKINHYLIVIVILTIPFAVIFFNISDYLNNKPVNVSYNDIFSVVIPLIIALLFFKWQKSKLQFIIIETRLKREELINIIRDVGTELEWHAEIIENNIVMAKTHPGFWSGSWGEQITILFDGKYVYVNSICDPDKTSSITSMGRNRRNVQTLIERINISSANE